ncbi:hypothetical protein WK58_09270 [Burkholderia ubonensis]|uniref:recombinase family protein n=1 Tax=Burkholderia ubonensis TaxID=101571 RepID=UPI0007532EBF|nr:recombinase family protein [Burkholderia ubonensis]KVT78149.1 hypothetical protein WK58_09270 [Burkholderia ubonensis]
MRIGYARVSTDEQNLGLQVDALQHANCALLFEDHGISGAEFSRPGLDKALSTLRAGDSLVVWRLDRLGRSLSKLVNLVYDLGQRNIQFESLTESIDTKSPSGVLIFHLMAALSEFERSLISERTRAGMAAARARGKQIGRKPMLTIEQQNEARALLTHQPVAVVARHFNVHPRTLKRLVPKE